MPGFINRDYSQIIKLFNDYASDAFYQLQISVYSRNNWPSSAQLIRDLFLVDKTGHYLDILTKSRTEFFLT